MIELRILTGGRAGLTQAFSGTRVTIGRHPEADLQLDPQTDLQSSARHAALAFDGQSWFVRDLGSRNGTFVNGQRVVSDIFLSQGDRIVIGVGGPEIAVGLTPGSTASAAPLVGTVVQPTVVPTEAGTKDRPDTAERVRIGVTRETRRIRIFWGVMALFLAGLVLLNSVARQRDYERWTEERRALLSRVDSAILVGEATTGVVEGRVTGLQAALEQSQSEVRSLRNQISDLGQDRSDEDVAELQAQLQNVTQALRRQQLAANLDFDAIRAQNRQAVAMIYVEQANGEVRLATGFAVRPDGTVITNRHALGDGPAPRPQRVAVQFADSRQVWPARILATSEVDDLAAIRVVNLTGTVPTIRGVSTNADTVEVVAMIGFPLAASQASGPGETRVIDPLISAGVVMQRGADALTLQGYGAQGASGSPVFDGGGQVIGVVFGGRPEGDNPEVLAVPGARLAAFLRSVP